MKIYSLFKYVLSIFSINPRGLQRIGISFAVMPALLFAFFAAAAGGGDVLAQGESGKSSRNSPDPTELFNRFNLKNKLNDNLGDCPAMPISFGQTINGSLTNSDCADPDTGQVADVYIFTGTQGQAISSAFSSAQFDTLLFLFDLSGNVIAFNDNADSNTTNSRIPPVGVLTLPSTQQYILFATSVNPAGRGNYTLNLSGNAPSCDFTLNPTIQFFTAAGGTGSFTVTATSQSCAWQAQSNAAWITTSSGGSGNGTVTFSVAANGSTQARGGFITVGTRTFSVQQAALECVYSTTPNPLEVPAYGGQRSFTLIVTNPLCTTSISTADPWLTILNPTGSGTRVINYVATRNNGNAVRSGVLTVVGAGRQLDITQLGRKTPFSFDTGYQANLSLYRPDGGLWIYKYTNTLTGEPSPSNSIFAFGLSTDKPAPADFDGDGYTDYAVFRSGSWYIIQSRTNTFRAVQFGQAGDKPLPADFDGDLRADVNVFRPSTGDWFRLNSSDNQFNGIRFGTSEDIPLITDFNADGKNEISVYRPSIGAWYWLDSVNGNFNAVNFGVSSDIPIPADYDGDGKTDVAVFRPSNGFWYRFNSTDNQFVSVNFGTTGDIPVAADYDADGKADTAVFRPSNGTWYRLRSASNQFDAFVFGANGDIPIPAAYQP